MLIDASNCQNNNEVRTDGKPSESPPINSRLVLTDGNHYVYKGNCVEIMDSWATHELNCDLIFADPPFNIGHDYDICNDTKSKLDYLNFYGAFMSAAVPLLRTDGLLIINTPDDNVKKTENFAEYLGLQRVDWIIWHYRFGQCGRTKFISSHCHCLVYVKGGGPFSVGHTFNAEDVMVESDRYARYGDPRTLDSETPGKRVPLDVWDIPRVVGNAKERVAGHPNQLPEKYLDRIIRAYTNPGDLVLDPFGGTGTTAAVAKKLNRRSVSLELSMAYCNDIVHRLRDIDDAIATSM